MLVTDNREAEGSAKAAATYEYEVSLSTKTFTVMLTPSSSEIVPAFNVNVNFVSEKKYKE